MSYSKDECIKAIHYVSEKIEGSPSIPQYNKHKMEHQPSVSSITRAFNGWNAAKEKAGESVDSKRYTKQECIDAVQYVVEKIDESPTIKQYYNHKKESHPSLKPIQNHFNSLNELKNKLGLSYHKKKYKKQECIDALLYVKDKINKSPTSSEYAEYREEYHPSRGLIGEKFESFNEAKKKAGLEINKHTRNQEIHNYSKNDILSALKYVSNRINESPSTTQYKKYKKDKHPNRNYISKKFGSWNNAKEKAGLETHNQYNYTKKECILAIDFVSKTLNKSPSVKEYNKCKKEEHPSVSSIRNNLESWDNAKNILGLKTRTYYTRKECLDSLEQVYNQLNHSPTSNEYDENRNEKQPSSATIKKRLGSWNNARNELGLDTTNHNKKSIEDMIKGILFVASHVAEAPSVNQYNKYKRNIDPHSSSIRERFGSWNKAKIEAGFDIEYKNDYEREDCIKSLRNAAERIEKSPSISEYNDFRLKTEPSASYIMREFKTWNDAKKCAKLEITKPNHKIYFNENDCINAIKYVKNILDKPPTENEYSKAKLANHPSSSVISDLFGSWNNAKKVAGISIYRNGDNINYPYGNNWSRKRNIVLKRDNYQCVKCGLKNSLSRKIHNRGLDVHHIHKLAKFYSDINDNNLSDKKDFPKGFKSEIKNVIEKSNHISNLVSLCRDCHVDIENKTTKKQLEILDMEQPKYEP